MRGKGDIALNNSRLRLSLWILPTFKIKFKLFNFSHLLEVVTIWRRKLPGLIPTGTSADYDKFDMPEDEAHWRLKAKPAPACHAGIFTGLAWRSRIRRFLIDTVASYSIFHIILQLLHLCPSFEEWLVNSFSARVKRLSHCLFHLVSATICHIKATTWCTLEGQLGVNKKVIVVPLSLAGCS